MYKEGSMGENYMCKDLVVTGIYAHFIGPVLMIFDLTEHGVNRPSSNKSNKKPNDVKAMNMTIYFAVIAVYSTLYWAFNNTYDIYTKFLDVNTTVHIIVFIAVIIFYFIIADIYLNAIIDK